MGFVVSALTNYVDQTSTDLLVATQFEGETADYANVQSGIKSAAALQLLAIAPIAADGEECGYTSTGSVTFTQRTLTTKAVKYQQDFCLRDLQAKWTQVLLKKGQNYTESDFPKQIANELVNYIKMKNEITDWQGDTTSGDAFLARYDGLLKIIDAAADEIIVTPQAQSVANARTIARALVNAVPSNLKGNSGLIFFVGYDFFDMYVEKLATDNLYNAYAQQTGTNYGLLGIENSLYKMKAVHGLDGTKRIIGMIPADNMFLGVDMENEEEEFKIWYSMDTDLIKSSVRFRRGWQVAYPSQIIAMTNT